MHYAIANRYRKARHERLRKINRAVFLSVRSLERSFLELSAGMQLMQASGVLVGSLEPITAIADRCCSELYYK